jgi:hypothetical protein
MKRQRAGFKRRAQQVFKGPQEEAGSWVQGQAGHTPGIQKGNRQAWPGLYYSEFKLVWLDASDSRLLGNLFYLW